MKKILILFIFLNSGMTFAQDDKSSFEQFLREDSIDVNTLAAYPENIRQHVFEVASQPQAVSRLGDLQKKTNEQFKNLLASYSKEEQQKIWNLTRYDNLISDLSKTKSKAKKIETILKKYPAEVHDDALEYALNHHELLVSIDKENQNFSKSFGDISKDYPVPVQNGLSELIKLPEVITILHSNMHLAVALGDYYKRSPLMVKQEFNSLNLELAKQKAKDAEEWKETLKNNPDAANELKESAKDYAKENGYKENDYIETNPVVIEHYHVYPYPFWCGYPWWYEYEFWYPHPYWYHWGFYFWHREVVWIGPPSHHFLHWHFHGHPHFYNYPHITHVYLNYYYGPRRAVATNTREVHQWVRENRPQLPPNFLDPDNKRVERIREYGKLEMKIDQIKKDNPGQPVKRDEYIKSHSAEYPDFQPKAPMHEEIVKPKEEPVPQKTREYQEKKPVRQIPEKTTIPAKPERPQQPPAERPPVIHKSPKTETPAETRPKIEKERQVIPAPEKTEPPRKRK